jgi:hypothetical protein
MCNCTNVYVKCFFFDNFLQKTRMFRSTTLREMHLYYVCMFVCVHLYVYMFKIFYFMPLRKKTLKSLAQAKPLLFVSVQKGFF